MDSARHSDINLTMERYSHTIVTDRTRAHIGLPDLANRPDAERLRAERNETADGGIRTHDPSFTKAVLYH